jgi:phosphoesterase RecJ-like protein
MMNNLPQEHRRAADLVHGAQRIIVITHLSPDGDAFGSMLGTVNALRGLGKTVTPCVDEGLAPRFAFLPGAADILPTLDGVSADLAIATDCSDERRMGKAGEAIRTLGIPLINIDHHRTNTAFGTVNIVNADTVSAAETVLDWLEDVGIPVDTPTAQCLLCGLVTDTQCFRTDNVTAGTLAKAQRLMMAGGQLNLIVQKAMNRMSLGVIRLWGEVFPTVKCEDGVIWAKLTYAAREKASGGDKKADGDLVTMLLQVDEAAISCVIREEKDGSIDLSMRGVPGYNVAEVALAFGGGGHTLAAGARLAGTLDSVEAQVIPLLKEAVRKGTPVY